MKKSMLFLTHLIIMASTFLVVFCMLKSVVLHMQSTTRHHSIQVSHSNIENRDFFRFFMNSKKDTSFDKKNLISDDTPKTQAILKRQKSPSPPPSELTDRKLKSMLMPLPDHETIKRLRKRDIFYLLFASIMGVVLYQSLRKMINIFHDWFEKM